MKALLIATFALLSVSAQAASMFTPAQERKALEAVQEACNNTWCEGEFGYDFKKFQCEKRKCALDFDIVVYTRYDDGVPDPTTADHYDTRCEFSPVKNFADVINVKKNYVTPAYFKSLAKCIDENASAIGQPKGQNSEPNPPMPLPVEVKNQSGSPSDVQQVYMMPESESPPPLQP